MNIAIKILKEKWLQLAAKEVELQKQKKDDPKIFSEMEEIRKEIEKLEPKQNEQKAND